MKRIALAATVAGLMAAPGMAEDAEIAIVGELFIETPCSVLTRLVVDQEPRSAYERQLRIAAYGFIVGRAMASGALGLEMVAHIKADTARIAEACDGHPDRTWQSILYAR